MNLTDFLLARIAEDEAVAGAAADAPNLHSDGPTGAAWDAATWDYARTPVGIVVDSHDNGLWDHEGSGTLAMAADAALHVARFDPKRVLAECEAKRRIVESEPRTWVHGADSDEALHEWQRVLTALARPYADHPDYRQDWKFQ